MKPYVEKLRLKHDPFDGEFQRNDFFGGGGRENLLHNVLAGADRQVSLNAVIGPEGSGKTRLAYRFCELSGNDFRPVLISVDLFTTVQYLPTSVAATSTRASNRSASAPSNSRVRANRSCWSSTMPTSWDRTA